MTKNETTVTKTYNNRVEVWVRGEERFVRDEVERMLNDMSLKWGYGIGCEVKPEEDSTRVDGSWVAKLTRSGSCD